ncbi:MAG: NAD-dependent epimerase/dehydratase family protein [Desulfobacteraceae bacterium]|nr:NAD-dependent epimerase/dehydratase family protein [Desulfobacteraceae bacterium]
MRVFITGAGGFIGRRAVEYLAENKDLQLRVMPGRTKDNAFTKNRKTESVPCRDINENTPWDDALAGVDTVVHLAARAHVLNEAEDNALELFRKVNVKGSLNLGKQAVRAGVKRFVFMSSIGVNGNRSLRPFTANDPPNPLEPYAVSKLEAEQGLGRLAQETGMELVIIRPVLVYGPGAPGNFARLAKMVQKGVPLPLGAVRNKRSLAAVDNLVDLIAACIKHPAAPGKTFLVSDGRDLSTPELIRKLADAIGCAARLVPVPPALLRLAGLMTGKPREMEKLTGSLQVDISHTCDTLNWQPPVCADKAIKDAAASFVNE